MDSCVLFSMAMFSNWTWESPAVSSLTTNSSSSSALVVHSPVHNLVSSSKRKVTSSTIPSAILWNHSNGSTPRHNLTMAGRTAAVAAASSAQSFQVMREYSNSLSAL